MNLQRLRTTLTRVLLPLGALAMAAAVAACGSTAQGAADGKPTFVIGQQESGIVSLVRDSGALKGAPYNIKWAVFPFGPPLVAAAASGQIDLGDVGDVPPINGAAKEAGFKVIAAENYVQATDFLIVPKGSAITSLADLRGKRVGVPVGSSAHGLLLNAVKSAGLSPQSVHFVNLAPAALQTAFRSGDVDAASLWNPQVALDVENGARILLAGHPPLDPNVGFYVGADKDLSNPQRRALLADLLRRLQAAYHWGDQHQSVWIKDVQQETGIDAKTAATQVKTNLLEVGPVTPTIVKTEQALAQTFYEAGQISRPVTVSGIVDNLLAGAKGGQ
ncbi:MAG: sulfonate transport system substrate-binding protein [Solirubrobacteraceae bacterium]|jgi:sulfonate transport system substrate-binding protein|nr:sulfonate transport system substrate-binding protein [Solirubrobacteraceae bacterium]